MKGKKSPHISRVAGKRNVDGVNIALNGCAAIVKRDPSALDSKGFVSEPRSEASVVSLVSLATGGLHCADRCSEGPEHGAGEVSLLQEGEDRCAEYARTHRAALRSYTRQRKSNNTAEYVRRQVRNLRQGV